MLSRLRVCLFAVLGATACGAAEPVAQPAPGPTATPTAASALPPTPASAEPTTPPPRAEPKLGRSYVGEGPPTVTVHNGYPLAQHVFVDGRPVRSVEPAATASFELEPGVHTLTCANSADPADLPSSLTESFETGYRYRYDIQAR